jgi:hypothetical protein
MNLLLRFATIALVAVGLSGVGKTAKSETIATWQQTLGSGRYGVFTDVPVDLGDVVNYFDSDPFLHWLLTNSDVGQTIYRDDTDPQFAAFVANLTNGIDNDLVFNSAGSGSGATESGIFGGVIGGNGIDLAGFQIDKIGLRVDSLSIVSPGSDPNEDGQWTTTSGQISFLFDGVRTVPEPSTYAMALAGLACGGYSMWRRRKRA